ncbi:MAG: sulfotransferase [Vicinamibacterales bacterium]
MSYRPLFAASLARSGGTMVCGMLSAHPRMMVASDPYLELFRSLRNALVNTAGATAGTDWSPTDPLDDYYYDDRRIARLDAVLNGSLDTPFDPAEWEAFLVRLTQRAALACAELVPGLPGIRARTYRGVFDRAIDLIAGARGAGDREWVGMKEVWTAEFLPLLLRSYADARAVIVLRDPRAMICSMLGVARTHPDQLAHVLSYARHWRKAVAVALALAQDPALAGRCYLLMYEKLMSHSRREAESLCRFLDVPFDPVMLEPSGYVNFATGAVWERNSAFGEQRPGMTPGGGERWQTVLDPRAVALIELVCGPDMRALGYTTAANRDADPLALEYLVATNDAYANWRTDFRDPERDYHHEISRRALLAEPPASPDPAAIRRSFLFPGVYADLTAAYRTGEVRA